MKRLAVCFFLFGLCANIAVGQAKYSVNQQREDVKYFSKMVCKIHPRFLEKKEVHRLDSLTSKVLSEITKPQDLEDFNLYLITSFNHYFDGHTAILWHDSLLHKKMTTPLVRFEGNCLVNDSLFLDAQINRMQSGTTRSRLQLESIGGMDIDSFLQAARSMYSSENKYYWDNFIQSNLALILPLFVKYTSRLPVTYLLDGKLVADTILFSRDDVDGIDTLKNSIIHKNITYNNSFDLFRKDSIAVLYLRNFLPDQMSAFKHFLVNAFSEINASGVKYLFVDLISNTGGTSDCGSELLRYIPIPSSRLLLMRTLMRDSKAFRSELLKYYVLTNPSISKAEQKVVRKEINHNIYNKFVDTYEEVDSQETRLFKGQIIFLQSRQTYSAPINLLSIVKIYNLGVIVGEETGGLTQGYINSINGVLPNSGIPFQCSTRYFEFLNSEKGAGVKPDIRYPFSNQIMARGDFKIAELKKMRSMVENYLQKNKN